MHRFNVIYNSFGANLRLHTHSIYIYLLIRYHCNVALLVLNFVNFDKIANACDANGKCHQQNGSNECKYFIKRLHSPVSERPFGRRRWKPARVLELKNVVQFCWRRNIDCFRTPMHTFCFSIPLYTNHMKQSQLEVNVL